MNLLNIMTRVRDEHFDICDFQGTTELGLKIGGEIYTHKPIRRLSKSYTDEGQDDEISTDERANFSYPRSGSNILGRHVDDAK